MRVIDEAFNNAWRITGRQTPVSALVCINNVATCASVSYSIALTRRKRFKMRVIVKKWGNSASIRIPAAIMEAASLRLDETVDVREEGGRIVIEPIRPGIYDLDLLLADITPENLHTEVSFGPAVGKEAF
jgi:antitoxin MazE